MIIGFIGFGKVTQNLIKLIRSDDIEFATSFENRQAKKTDITVFETFRELAIKSDVVISANSPKSALEVAQKYGKYANGIYLDLNNISPKTAVEISDNTNNFVDGAIIGKIDSDNPIIYLSGENAKNLEFLNEFLDVRIISDKIGDASLLKILRSTYTKTLSALLIESYTLARINGLENEFFDILALTEGDEFRQKSLSRIANTINSSKRKSEELQEIIEYFHDEELTMTRAALEKIKRYQS